MAQVRQPRPFTEAFTAWFAAAADLHDIMTVEPCVDRDAVEIEFLSGDGALHGHVHPIGISIAALFDGECWDLLFDDDLGFVDKG